MSEAMQTPLTELLRMTPDDLLAEWPSQWSEDGCETGHTISPVGKHCHQAADRIDKLEQQLAELNSPVQLSEWQKMEAKLAECKQVSNAHCLQADNYRVKLAEQREELEETRNAIHQWMQTTDQRGSKDMLIANFVGMYTYKEISDE